LKFLTTLILMMMLATGCNVEEGSGGSLIAGHVPVENKFEITLPTNASYDNGAHLEFLFKLPLPRRCRWFSTISVNGWILHQVCNLLIR